MGQKWIIEVLRDLCEFADANELDQLAGQLRIAQAVAQDELDPKIQYASSGVRGHEFKIGRNAGGNRNGAGP